MGNFLKSIAVVFFALMLIISAGWVAEARTWNCNDHKSKTYNGPCQSKDDARCKKTCHNENKDNSQGYCKNGSCICALC
ncbi:hypothetical protein CASFOL_009909 [Castilleja foliolosa]|uniref:Uncharacterized protein n=1 Tax=Castilleja foliolosa TaxID=1961234 RepID=A0ABD3DS59_9LAMI